MEIKNISIGKTPQMNDKVEFTVEHEGRSIRFKSTRSTKGWNVYCYKVNEVWIPKKGRFEDIIYREIGVEFVGTREQFIEGAWQQGEKKNW
ncbi:hypothetical protein [Paenibacillus macquariensis]|uniref:Uncharacterized protein n=1 Tax=Paenibacillus macquariensis TaxID=948756 RepID=A0ABY1KEM2_9BACL|nr:hypothetical protein [Paenibacillus macquariensis]MEC0094362.1 hypothetical protein [Paenibacillus macquariensis]OAB27726.1 hypothetical protein PMSM_24650 [Paenibacillus macquariensis subsp. macquariensis]SIR71984.1 hypothetical protein SAMN05421578_1453 [Paenibacillus macquariensis]